MEEKNMAAEPQVAEEAAMAGAVEERLEALRRENEALRARQEAVEERQRAAFAALEAGEAEVRALYGDYDWRREAENREFADLIAAGVSPRTAYEVVHREELLQRAMAYATRTTARRTVRSIESRHRAIRENGGRSTALGHSDPRSLTRQELSDIRRRVMEGEKIKF